MLRPLALALLLSVTVLGLGCAQAPAPAAAPAAPPVLEHRWLFVFGDLSKPGRVEKSLAFLPRAKAAGYNGIVLSDAGLHRLDLMSQAYRDGVVRIQQETKKLGMDFVPVAIPMAWSNSVLKYDPNLAEGLPVRNARYVARGGVLQLAPEQPVSLSNGGFEEVADGAPVGWGARSRTGTVQVPMDEQVVHGGKRAVGMPAGRGAGLSTQVAVRPFQHYDFTVWVKTQDIERPERTGVSIARADGGTPARTLSYYQPPFQKTQDWTQYHFVFNSLESTKVAISLRGSGGVWFDDAALTEVGPVNVLRRAGTPVTLAAEDGTAYQEGVDYEKLVDPKLNPEEIYHTPPVVKLTPTSAIKEGQEVFLSYYHPVLIHDGQTVACISDPKLLQILRHSATQLNNLLHPDAFFLQHDEIRAGNWDVTCQSRHLTPGQMLAENMQECLKIVRELNPKAKLWVWSDMFDPNHNARDEDSYYFVNGNWSGSWEGLPSDVGIVNWAGFRGRTSAQWFADRGHEQILSGYYDHDDDGEGIANWLASTRDLPKVTGAMYTSWLDRYDSLEKWAEAAWGGAAAAK